MAVLYSQRRWVHLLALIEGLPTASRYTQAIHDDEEMAEKLLDSGLADSTGDYHPPLKEWTTEVSFLAEISDKLSTIQATQVGVAGGKSKTPKPSPRPETAIDRVKARREREAQQSIINIFAPKN